MLMNTCIDKISPMKLVVVIKLEDGIMESNVMMKLYAEIAPLILDVLHKKVIELIPLTNSKTSKGNKI